MQTTTTSLEDTLRAVVEKGDLTHISLTPSQDGKTWRAAYTPAKKFGVIFAEDPDPVKALLVAFGKQRKPVDISRRAIDGAEARANACIEQPMVEVPVPATPDEVDSLM